MIRKDAPISIALYLFLAMLSMMWAAKYADVDNFRAAVYLSISFLMCVMFTFSLLARIDEGK